MKHLALLSLACLSLSGLSAETGPTAPAYDADLFRKDTRVYFFWNIRVPLLESQ